MQGDVLDEGSVGAAMRGQDWDKTRQERMIAGSTVDWVIVRPGVLTDGEKRGRSRHGRRVGSFFLTVRIPARTWRTSC
jgi:NAD(P)H-binding